MPLPALSQSKTFASDLDSINKAIEILIAKLPDMYPWNLSGRDAFNGVADSISSEIQHDSPDAS